MKEKNKSLLEEYFDYQLFYQKKYGTNTIVLMEIGSFFETYQYEDIGKAKEVSELLNIQLTKKNKSEEDTNIKNPFMAGIPSIAIERHLNVLMSQNKYTIIKIEQTSLPPNVNREVTEILSPGTTIEQRGNNNFLMSLFIEEFNEKLFAIGISMIDVSTGETIVYETLSNKQHKEKPFEDLTRYLSNYNPKEIVVTFKDVIDEEYFIREFNFKQHNYKNIKYENKTFKNDYINQVFNKIYENETMLSGIENIDLELFNYASYSLQNLILFLIEHNETLLKKINQPKIINEHEQLKLANNSIYQLNILSNKSQELNEGSLYSILNNCMTVLGSRLLKNSLISPTTNIKKLNEDYSMIETYLDNKEFERIRKKLFGIFDLERLFRKIGLEKISPTEFYTFYLSLLKTKHVFEEKVVIEINNTQNEISILNKFIEYIEQVFEITELKKYNQNDIDGIIFKKGFSKKIDLLLEKKETLLEGLDSERYKLESKLGFDVKLESTDKLGFHLSLSKSKFKNINIDKNVYRTKTQTNKIKIYNDKIDTLSEKMVILKQQIIQINRDLFIEEMSKLYIGDRNNLENVIYKLAKLDLTLNNTYNAYKFNYSKPRIVENCSGSFVNIKKLRHPIVEQLINTDYISNDIKLDDKNTGKLIFGVNATGKSTILKATGLAVIMAQAGMYVSCNMDFCPFEQIFTRITGEDNLFKNHSTFTIEMLELKQILNLANEKSLVLADEMSHGTETSSAVAIVGSSIKFLIDKNIKFLLTTHLHQLNKISYIQEEEKLSLEHLSVFLDESNDKLIYKRKLENGSGDSIYGLIVAKGLGLDNSFIMEAKSILREFNEYSDFEILLNNKSSKYNINKIKSLCEICSNTAEDTHHIEEQATQSKGFTKSGKMNRTSNLVNLCKKCHNKVHEGKIKIEGYKMTSEGVKLLFDIL